MSAAANQPPARPVSLGELPAAKPGAGSFPPRSGHPFSYDPYTFGLFLWVKRLHRALSRAQVDRQAGLASGACRRAEERRDLGAGEFEALCVWQGEQPEIFCLGGGV